MLFVNYEIISAFQGFRRIDVNYIVILITTRCPFTKKNGFTNRTIPCLFLQFAKFVWMFREKTLTLHLKDLRPCEDATHVARCHSNIHRIDT